MAATSLGSTLSVPPWLALSLFSSSSLLKAKEGVYVCMCLWVYPLVLPVSLEAKFAQQLFLFFFFQENIR